MNIPNTIENRKRLKLIDYLVKYNLLQENVYRLFINTEYKRDQFISQDCTEIFIDSLKHKKITIGMSPNDFISIIFQFTELMNHFKIDMEDNLYFFTTELIESNYKHGIFWYTKLKTDFPIIGTYMYNINNIDNILVSNREKMIRFFKK